MFYDVNKMNEVVLEINEDIRTEREAFFKERIGQSLLKEKLLKEKRNCELCGINKKELLIASHIKPWSESNDVERLDINNVLCYVRLMINYLIKDIFHLRMMEKLLFLMNLMR